MSNVPLIVAGWALGWLLLWRIPRLRPAGPPSTSPSAYAVVIPARNEAHNIGVLVTQLLGQTVPPAEIVVVDDDSTDGTGATAACAGATVVRGAELPVGWVGKTWACQQGAEATTAPLLVFLDADVRVAPEALGAVVSQVHARGGIVSIAPWHMVERPYEWLSMLFGIVSVMGVGFASAYRRDARGAFGPCIALRRRDYDAIGGHAGVRNEVVEDLAMANRAADHNVSVSVMGGGRDMTYRMYPTGVRSLVEGWSKNIATGARFTSPLRTLAISIWVAALLAVLVAVLDGPLDALPLLAPWGVQILWMARQTGSFPARSLLVLPIIAAVFVALFVRSFLLTTLRGRVTWRGRSIPVHRGAQLAAITCGERDAA